MQKEMIKAAKNGNIEQVKALLAADKSLIGALDSDGSTPLHCAVWKGHQPLVEILLEAGADIHAHNQNGHWGTTPLHAAAHADQKAIAAWLIARGADVNAKDIGGKTPLHHTTIHNARATAKLLRGHGAE